MVRRDLPSRSDPERNLKPSGATVRRRAVDFDIYQELAQLQEMVYESFHIPLTRWTVIDEGRLLDQLEVISDSVPEAIKRALAIIEQEEYILSEAEAGAQRLIQSAQQRAAQMLDETGIVQQAEQQALQFRQQIQQECEVFQRDTLAEVEQMRQLATQELQQFRQQILEDCDQTQAGADKYADDVLTNLEQKLAEMLQVVRNGRQQLYDNSPTRNPAAPKKLPDGSRKRSQG